MIECIAGTSSQRPSISGLKHEWWEMGRHALLLLALLAAMYSPVWLAGKTLMPWTGLEQIEWPKEATRPLTRTALDTADTIFLLAPWDAYSLRCMTAGEWPWWNPYQGLGDPHWENIVTAGLSPGMWIEGALPTGLKEFVWLGQLWVSAVFTMMLARALGLSWAGTTLAGVAVITAPHFELYMTQRHMSGTAMWWPLALWGVECLRRSFITSVADYPGTALASRLLGFCGMAVGMWGLLTGGNPSITLAGGSGLILYALARLPWRTGARPMLACSRWFVLAGVTGLSMAAPSWVNFFPWLAVCYSRRVDPISLASGPAGHVVFAPRHLGAMLLPYIYGQTMEYPFGRLPRWLWSAFGGWHPAIVVFLSMAGVCRACKQKSGGLLALSFITLGVIARSYGMPWTEWVAGLPLWRDVSFTRYVAFIPVFGFALLAGYGLEVFSGGVILGRRRFAATKRARLAIAGTWVILMAMVLLLAFNNLPNIGNWSKEAVTNWRHFAWLGLFWSVAPVLTLLWSVGVENGEAVSNCHARVLWPAVLGLALTAVVFAPWGYSPLTHSLLGIAGGILLLAATLCANRFQPDAWLTISGERPQTALRSYDTPRAERGQTPVSGAPRCETHGARSDAIHQRQAFPRVLVLVAALAGVASLPLCVSLWAKNALPPKFDPIPKAGLISALSKLQSANYSRSWSLDGLPVPDQAMASGVFSLNVINGLITHEEADYSSKYLDPHCTPLWLAGNVSFIRNPGESSLEAYLSRRAFYEFAAVRYVTSLAPLPGLRPLLRDESGMMLWEDIDTLPRVRLVAPDVAAMPPPDAVRHRLDPATGSAEIQSFGPNEVKIRAVNSKPCVLVLADAPKVGWNAWINGHPAELFTAHGCFRAVKLPEAGTWEVRMRYRPPWWNVSWILAGVGLICFALRCGWLYRQSQKLS